MHPSSSPELSVIIVAYNSLSDLVRCLPSIQQAANGRIDYELIIVDNYGRDGLATWLKTNYPSVQFILNRANTGYAGGNNLGLAKARGTWTLLLNPDTEVGLDSLVQLLQTIRAHPDALITPKLLNPNGTINACGNQMHYTGVTTCRGLNQPASAYNELHEVPLLSGAAVLANTERLRRLGGFNESYFMYFEDTDLSLRARLSGYILLCEARAEIRHFYTLGLSPTKFFYLERNRLRTLYGVLTRATFRQLLPGLFITELLMWGFALRGPRYLRARVRTYAWLWRNRSAIGEAHRQIQQTRRVSDATLLRDSLVALPFDQLVSGQLGRWLNGFFKPIYALLKPVLRS